MRNQILPKVSFEDFSSLLRSRFPTTLSLSLFLSPSSLPFHLQKGDQLTPPLLQEENLQDDVKDAHVI